MEVKAGSSADDERAGSGAANEPADAIGRQASAAAEHERTIAGAASAGASAALAASHRARRDVVGEQRFAPTARHVSSESVVVSGGEHAVAAADASSAADERIADEDARVG